MYVKKNTVKSPSGPPSYIVVLYDVRMYGEAYRSIAIDANRFICENRRAETSHERYNIGVGAGSPFASIVI